MGLFQDLHIPLNSESPSTEAKSHEALLKEVENRISNLTEEIEHMEHELPRLKEVLSGFQKVQPVIEQQIKYLKENADRLAETWNWQNEN